MHKPLRLALVIAAIYSSGVLAQSNSVDIAAQSLPKALTSLATQIGLQILFNPDELKGLQARSLNGKLTPEEALRQLLEGSGFVATGTGKDSYAIHKRPQSEGVKSLPEVLVTAERARAYNAAQATIASKVPLTPREIAKETLIYSRPAALNGLDLRKSG